LRTGRTEDGEALLREALRAGPSAEAWRALLDLRLAVKRVAGAEEDLRDALNAFPADCGIRASAAALYAMLGREDQAVAEIQTGERLGCPPLEWVRRPGMAERLDRPAFRALLRPGALASGLVGLDDGEARFRLQLLEKAMGPEAIAPLEEDILRRRDYGIRLREIHLLLCQWEKSLPALDRLLREGDLMVRKLLLRQMALSPDPLRIPLLEAHLEREAAPGNRSLAALALAKAYEKAGRRAEAEALLRSIPEADPLYPEAREILEGKPPAER
jgi:tetratricopeptide (TPR) repeat protein